MKTSLNEIKRMQKLAGLIKENMGIDSIPKEKVKEWIWYAGDEGFKPEFIKAMNSFLDNILAGSEEVTREQFDKLVNYSYDQPGHGLVGHGADPSSDELFDDMLNNII